MRRLHAVTLVLALFADACGVNRRGPGSHLASGNDSCEVNPKDVDARCKPGGGVEPKDPGNRERRDVGRVTEFHVDAKGGASHARIEMTMVARYEGPPPKAGRGLTRETFGPGAPTPRPDPRRTRDHLKATLAEVQAGNGKDAEKLDGSLASSERRLAEGQAATAAMIHEATAAHNAAAASITDDNGLGEPSSPDPSWDYMTPRETPAGRRLDQTKTYREFVAEAVATSSAPDKEAREKLVDLADVSMDLADDQFFGQSPSVGDALLDLAVNLLDIAISASPVGAFYDAGQLATGYNIQGDKLSDLDKAIIAASILLPTVTPSAAKNLGDALERIATSKPVAGQLAKLLGLAQPVIDAAAKLGVPARYLPAFGKIFNGMSKNPGGFPIERIRMGSNPNVIAVIGRGMDDVVSPTAQHLQGALGDGVRVRTFQQSRSAADDFADRLKEYQEATGDTSGRLPYDLVKNSKTYTENKEWIEQARRDGATIMDLGDPKNKGGSQGPSAYHDMERGVAFGD